MVFLYIEFIGANRQDHLLAFQNVDGVSLR